MRTSRSNRTLHSELGKVGDAAVHKADVKLRLAVDGDGDGRGALGLFSEDGSFGVENFKTRPRGWLIKIFSRGLYGLLSLRGR